MEGTGRGQEDAEKRHKQTDQTGREGKFVFLVAEFWYEFLFKHIPCFGPFDPRRSEVTTIDQ